MPSRLTYELRHQIHDADHEACRNEMVARDGNVRAPYRKLRGEFSDCSPGGGAGSLFATGTRSRFRPRLGAHVGGAGQFGASQLGRSKGVL